MPKEEISPNDMLDNFIYELSENEKSFNLPSGLFDKKGVVLRDGDTILSQRGSLSKVKNIYKVKYLTKFACFGFLDETKGEFTPFVKFKEDALNHFLKNCEVIK